MTVLACSIHNTFSSPLQAGAVFYHQPRGTAIHVDTQTRVGTTSCYCSHRVHTNVSLRSLPAELSMHRLQPQSSALPSLLLLDMSCTELCLLFAMPEKYHLWNSQIVLLFITLISRSMRIFALGQLNMKAAAATVSLGELWPLINKLLKEDNGSGICWAN